MGTFSAGGLISGLDSNALISQLMQLERAPIRRLETRITGLNGQRDAVRSLRTQLQTLRNRVQDFRLSNIFNAFEASSSETTVATAEISAANPVVGAFNINVTKLASATSARSSAQIGANIDPNAVFNSNGLAGEKVAGTFSINGVQFNFDPTTQSLNDILGQINSSAAGVTATYDSGGDVVQITNSTADDISVINFGASGDTANFLSLINITGATQVTVDGETRATSTRHLGGIDATAIMNNEQFAAGAITAGSFSINGVSISVDPTQDSIIDIIARINASDAKVTASYDTATDSLRFVSNTLGSRTINFGGGSDTSNFLTVTNLTAATQTAGDDAQFTVNNGPVQTRNTNAVADAISGVTVNFLSTGTTTVTVGSDDDSIVEDVREFITGFNDSVQQIRDTTAQGAALAGDGTIRGIETFLRQNIFNMVSGIAGDLKSVLDLGISTGKDFDSEATQLLSLDEDKFRQALRDDRLNVEQIFSNGGGNGIADVLYSFLDEATATTGFLNERAKANGAIDTSIRNLNDQIGRIEDRLAQKEERLRRQFLRLETLSSGFQSQNAALAGLSSGMRFF